MPRLGERMSYRPMPADFADTFVRLGFNETCFHYRAHWRNVAAWIEANGGDELRRKRIAHLDTTGQRRAINYVMGRRLRRRLMAVDVAPESGE